jgi:hypothetical protein
MVKVKARTHFESLFAGFIRRLINDDIVLRPREVFMLERIERALSIQGLGDA